MKATLEFDLDSIDDETKYKLANAANDAFRLLWDLDQALRSFVKWGSDDPSVQTFNGSTFKTTEEFAELIREMIYEQNLLELYQ